MLCVSDLSKKEKMQFLRFSFAKARRRFMPFCLTVSPYYKFVRHLSFLAECLERVESGLLKKLMIFMPPRNGKSDMTSSHFPAWFLGKNKEKRIIHASYAASLSNEYSRQSRDMVDDELYKAIFGVGVDRDVRAVDNWKLAGHRGGLLSIGVGGSATGHGADLFVIDDPIKNHQEAESEAYRNFVFDWYRSVARTRLEPGASIILMMARWHQKDLAGRILEEEKDWTIINLPALAKENDALGRAVGDPLWPERFPREQLLYIKSDIGSRFWNALYDGNPVDSESAIIQRSWIQMYNSLPLKTSRYGGIDTASSKKTSADNTSLVEVCRDKEGFLYVDDVFLEKVSATAFAKFVSTSQKERKFRDIRLESNNAGEVIKQRIDEVGREDGTHPPVRAVNTDTDKVVRVVEYQHLVENGTIKFKSGNPRVAKLIDHLVSFDGRDGADDDDVDALGFAIKAALSGARDLVHII